jgi:hypothetical protein
LAGVLVCVSVLAGCGGRFSYVHGSDYGPPVLPEAVALAQQHRLGPDGFGKIKLGMTFDQVQASGQFVFRKGTGIGGCRNGIETGIPTKPSGGGWVLVSDVYGVVKLSSYPGVRTPEGVELGLPIDKVKEVYSDTKVETERDMGNGQIEMDDHYRASVPGNPNAVYRFFVDRNDNVDSIVLVLAKQDCDVGFSN